MSSTVTLMTFSPSTALRNVSNFLWRVTRMSNFRTDYGQMFNYLHQHHFHRGSCHQYQLKFKSNNDHTSTLSYGPIRSYKSGIHLNNGSGLSTTTMDKPCQQHSTLIQATDEKTQEELLNNMLVHCDFISEEEETNLLNEIEPYLNRLHYEYNHWDNAIIGYRETERKKWKSQNKVVINRIRDQAFSAECSPMAYVHILDLEKEGHIKPHIDAVRFCGNTIAGISLLSTAVMQLTHDEVKSRKAEILLPRRSLYIMRGLARYNYAHAVMGETESFFRGKHIPRERRISVICRNEPE